MKTYGYHFTPTHIVLVYDTVKLTYVRAARAKVIGKIDHLKNSVMYTKRYPNASNYKGAIMTPLLTDHDIAIANLYHAADLFPLGSCVRTRDLYHNQGRIYGRVIGHTLTQNIAFVTIVTSKGHFPYNLLSIDLTKVQPSEMPS